MRVVCIDESGNCSYIPNVKKGRIYNVVDFYHHKEWNIDYYIFAECGKNFGYRTGCFIEINEDQKDETEFKRNYQTQTA